MNQKPPKKTSTTKSKPIKTTTIQLKRLTQTYFLALKHPVTLNALTEQLHEMIRLTGGLYDMTSEEYEGEEEEDIDIPIPEYGELSDTEPALTTSKSTVASPTGFIPDISELQISRCINPYDPYINEWTPYLDSDSDLSDLKEFEILGFAVDGIDETVVITEGKVGGGEYDEED